MRRLRSLRQAQCCLVLILFTGCILRFYRLGYQSFWLDELHTVIEADPAMSWKSLFAALQCCDQHPPLFFFAEKLVFALFGSSEWTARMIPAAAGVWGLWLIYLLGKELYSQRLGLLAALLTCINFFHIQYSQEARPYSLLFAAACGSFLYLLRILREPSKRHVAGYVAFTVLMLGTHYFGLFAALAQAVIAVTVLIWEPERRRLLLRPLLISAGLILLCFAPWTPFLLSMSAIHSFWIRPIEPGFALEYFRTYFGDSALLTPFAVLLLLLGMIGLLQARADQDDEVGSRRRTMLFFVCTIWIAICYLVPYLRSVLVVPMLYPRYTIVLLPAVILFLAFGFESVAGRRARNLLLALFCLLSLIVLIVDKRYYTSIHKAQVRELAKLISADATARFPVLSEVSGWHEGYYLRKNGYAAEIIRGQRSRVIDSILSPGRNRFNGLPGFWISDAHGSAKPDSALAARIDSSFLLLREHDLYGAWAQLYISRDAGSGTGQSLGIHSFPNHEPVVLDDDSVVAIWDANRLVSGLPLKAGRYTVNLRIKGTPAHGAFPRLLVRIDGVQTATFEVTERFAYHSFSFQQPKDTAVALEIVMINDENDPATGEDRNAFLQAVSFLRTGD